MAWRARSSSFPKRESTTWTGIANAGFALIPPGPAKRTGAGEADGARKAERAGEADGAGEADTSCPKCGKPLTIGVLRRVAQLADRPLGFRPPGAAGFTSLVQLPEIVSEILATGPKSKKVVGEVGRLVTALGPELRILRETPLDDIGRVGGAPLSEAIARLRRGEVIRDAGYDGEYGTIRLFQPGELDGDALFGVTGLLAPARAEPRRLGARASLSARAGLSARAVRPGIAARQGGIVARKA